MQARVSLLGMVCGCSPPSLERQDFGLYIGLLYPQLRSPSYTTRIDARIMIVK